MGRSPCCSKEGLNRGAWTAMEDKILTDFIKLHGEGKWRNLPKRAGLKRCGKSCRLRWLNYLRPDIKRGNITSDEQDLIIRLHNLLGNRWSLIAGRLPGRTDNEIKNYWNTNIGKTPPSSAHPKTTCRIPKPTLSNKTTHHYSDQRQNSSTTTSVVRTKATKCTKVVIFPHGQDQDQPITIEPKPINNIIHDHDNHEPLVNNKNNNDVPNVDEDDGFLSEFLNIDCLQHFADCLNDVEDIMVVNEQQGINFGHDDLFDGDANHRGIDARFGPVIDSPSDSNRRGEALSFSSQDVSFHVDIPELDWFQDSCI